MVPTTRPRRHGLTIEHRAHCPDRSAHTGPHAGARPTPTRDDHPYLALAGGLAWIVKIVLIWATGGTNTTGGAVGFVFLLGTTLLAAAAMLWTWGATRGRSILARVGLMLVALSGLLLAINLPTLVGQAPVPGSWLAGEGGVILVAVAAHLVALSSFRSTPETPGAERDAP